MITIKTKDLKPIGVLENAYAVGYEKNLNELWTATFSLPIDDKKNNLCQSFYVIDITDNDEFIGTFRIIPESTSLQNNEITYQCEHVISTLLDDVLFRYHQRSNFTTADNIQYILDQQDTEHWVLGNVEFTRYFHYKFENENGLLAPLLSIPKPFSEPYEWQYDTSVYPWVLSLVKPSERVVGELRWGKNMGSFDEVVDPTEIVNRIYPLGAGEGVNQLGIESVNDDVPYLEDAESIAKYGLRKYVWVDKRFEDSQQLKDNAQALLNQWKDPKVSIGVKGSDLSVLDSYEFERHRLGDLIRIVVPDREDHVVRIVRESKSDVTGYPHDIDFDLNNKLDDIATTQTDLERKQQVNDAYSQGATNILNYDYQDNCDENNPATIKFFLDQDVVNINTCELTFDTEEFRAYSQATEGGGATTVSTTSANGGGVSTSTASGGEHFHRLMVRNPNFDGNAGDNKAFSVYLKDQGTSSTLYIPMDAAAPLGDIYTFEATGDHTHDVSTPAHSHDVSVEIPGHTHNVKHGIYKLSTLPSEVEIRVDGNLVPHTAINADRLNIEPYLRKENGRITRDRHEITITPDAKGRVNANLILRVFIQSHIGTVL